MKNYVHKGEVLTVTAPYDLASGAGCLVGKIFGVSCGIYASGDTEAQIATVGVFNLAKDGSAFAQGDNVYWDDVAKAATLTAAGNALIGQAEVAVLAGGATVRVRLSGQPFVVDAAGAGITAVAAELNLLDGTIAGTVVASKALAVDAAKSLDLVQAKTALTLGGTGAIAAADTCTTIVKQVDALADTVATDVLTVTIPNAKHAAIIDIDFVGILGAGGAVGEGEAVCLSKYQVVTCRTAGVNAVNAISAAIGGAKQNVAGGQAITSVVATVSAVAGAVGVANTFTVKCAITRGGAGADNHKVVMVARVVNAFATGVTIA